MRSCTDFAGVSSLKLVRLNQPGTASLRNSPLSMSVRGQSRGRLGRERDRQRRAGVDRRAERDQRVDALVPPERRGLVREHAALRVAGEHDVASGLLAHDVDRFADGQDVVVEIAFEATRVAIGMAEVDDPGVEPVGVQRADGRRLRRHVPHLGREHERRDEQDRHRCVRNLVGEVVPQPVVVVLGLDGVGRGRLAGLEAAEAHDLGDVSRGRGQPAGQAPAGTAPQARCRSSAHSRR